MRHAVVLFEKKTAQHGGWRRSRARSARKECTRIYSYKQRHTYEHGVCVCTSRTYRYAWVLDLALKCACRRDDDDVDYGAVYSRSILLSYCFATVCVCGGLVCMHVRVTAALSMCSMRACFYLFGRADAAVHSSNTR